MSDLKQLAEAAVANRTFPGCVIGIVRKDGSREILPFGRFTYGEDSPAVTETSVYDCASITKAIPTASLALKLLEEGKIDLDDQVIEYVPEFNNNYRDKLLIRHLLTYGITYPNDGKTFAKASKLPPEELFDWIMHREFAVPPGQSFMYANMPAFLMGLVIERVLGKPINEAADEQFFTPLEMKQTTFFPETFPVEEIVPTEGALRGIVHDESARICKMTGKIVGHAGLFSTAPDLLNFLEMLLHGGELLGKRYFSPETMEQIQTNQIPHLNDSTGLGWELYQPRFMGGHCSPRTFGKTGFTGTLLVADIHKGIAYTILSNRVHPARPKDASAINAFRAAVGDILLA